MLQEIFSASNILVLLLIEKNRLQCSALLLRHIYIKAELYVKNLTDVKPRLLLVSFQIPLVYKSFAPACSFFLFAELFQWYYMINIVLLKGTSFSRCIFFIFWSKLTVFVYVYVDEWMNERMDWSMEERGRRDRGLVELLIPNFIIYHFNRQRVYESNYYRRKNE